MMFSLPSVRLLKAATEGTEIVFDHIDLLLILSYMKGDKEEVGSLYFALDWRPPRASMEVTLQGKGSRTARFQAEGVEVS